MNFFFNFDENYTVYWWELFSGKEPTCQCKNHRRFKLDPWVWKIPWRRKWQPAPQYSFQNNPMDRGAWLQSTGSQRVGHDWVTTYACAHVVYCLKLCCHLLGASFQFSSVQSLSRVWLFATPWTAARQASLSITNSWSLCKLMSIELVIPSNHLILCRPLLLPPSVFPSIRVFSDESILCIRWPKYWSFSFSISPSNEYSGLTKQSMEFSRPKYWSGWPFLLQGIFPTQGLNPGLPHCRQILYQMSHKGNPGASFRLYINYENIYSLYNWILFSVFGQPFYSDLKLLGPILSCLFVLCHYTVYFLCKALLNP